MPRDLYIDIEYDIKQNILTIIDTNVKRGEIKDLLEDWLRGQIGKGEDKREPNRQEKYHLKLEVDLTEDTFYMSSDTGNKGLTAGIVLNSLDKLILPEQAEEEFEQSSP